MADVRPVAFETSGRLAGPLVGLHTVRDPRVPFSQLTRYAFKVLLQGSLAFTPIPTSNEFGHCQFTRDEILLALGVLFFQVEGFDLTGVAALLDGPEALISFEERLAHFR